MTNDLPPNDEISSNEVSGDPAADVGETAPQRVVKVRRDYNTWVANETLEDYALRFTPRSFRRLSELRVVNTAFGGAASFLVLEAVGATMLVGYGFINALWAILAVGLIIALAGMPISFYAARHGVDMDLLTRGSGFGYLGSTLTSLIYASFTFIFFALEAAIMAYALEMALGIPPAWGYLICALVVIPMVTHGITVISRLQTWTQPLWLLLLALPFFFVLSSDPQALAGLWQYPGVDGRGGAFDWRLFAGAMTVGIALITQMGEQADYLRFMPPRTARNRWRWLIGVILGGPGWVLIGVVKMIGGALLAWMLLRDGMPPARAVEPSQMYLLGFSTGIASPFAATMLTALFVIVSQLKINITNAYAGSLAWSNFFSRLTHSHPGRVVWMVFNTLIALLLMEMNVFRMLGQVLGLYSNIAISWMMAVVADLVINKPLGLSPPGIEFKRSHLHDINPVGVGAMLVASLLSVATFVGLFGAALQPFASFVAIGTALVVSPLIAWATGGRYYLARPADDAHGTHSGESRRQCCICGQWFEVEDTSHCPAYQGTICSLCCSLDARCEDLCKPHARLAAQCAGLMAHLPAGWRATLGAGLGQYLLLMLGVGVILALTLGSLYYQEILSGETAAGLGPVLTRVFIVLMLLSGIGAWWMVLTHKSRQVAQEESERQTRLLMQEIESHHRTDEALQNARRVAEQANQAKSRYVTSISHELRTPLNSILGYAQILDDDETMPTHRRGAVSVIKKSGEHLLALIEDSLDIARIESGKFALDIRPLAFPAFIRELVSMFEVQARNKGLNFQFELDGKLPEVVRADPKRLRQILINILGNAVKFTPGGAVRLRLTYRREMALFEIVDSGAGIAPEDIERIFEPFAQGRGMRDAVSGTGLGLTISRMLTDLMGGELSVDSQSGVGSVFRVRLFLPQVHDAQAESILRRARRIGYRGVRRRILTVDNERVDRELLVNLLEPLGFEVGEAAAGEECLEMLDEFQPHLIFMDLAMPGIDGWETIRRLRAAGFGEVPLAVISANAFDRGLDNDVGLAAADFILKPIRVDELLDWIGRRLQLDWVWAEPAESGHLANGMANATATAAAWVLPPAEAIARLDEVIELGFPRGILATLSEIEALDPAYGEFVRVGRDLVRRFQFDAMRALLRRGGQESR
ncbi:MAG: response regulator [Azoarcus sp.]|jgi:signal transduction histidine kinase/CheY-like chemotaxis protein/purine-cytosine permease-like protein|nr:response regulator [Azoarcus sp.]